MKALFIGLGSIGQRHLRNLLALEPNAEIFAIRNQKSKTYVFNKNNKILKNSNLINKYKIQEYKNVSEALSKQIFNLIFITNPSSLHFKIAESVISSGAYIFIEKPAVHSEKDLKKLHILNEANNGKIFVGYQYRFHPAIKKSYKIINDNLLGNIVSARFKNGEYLPDWHPYEDYRASYAARKDLGGGALLTQIHDLDYASFLCGIPTELFAVGGKNSSLELDVEDSVQILMKIKINNNNIPVSISLNYLEKPGQRIFEVIGDQAKLECDLNRNIIKVSPSNGLACSTFSFSKYERNDMFIDEMKAFLLFASGNSSELISLLDASMSLKIAFLSEQSLKFGRVQTFK